MDGAPTGVPWGHAAVVPTQVAPVPPAPARRGPGAHRAGRTGVLGGVTGLAREALGLVVPLACAGCGAWDVVLCDACAALLAGPASRCEHAAPRLAVGEDGALPVWAAAAYRGPVRDVVVGWKDRGRTDVGSWLAWAVRAAARAAAPVVGQAARGAPVLVVPVPSRPTARLRRGGDRTAVLAAACAAGLRAEGVRARAAPALATRGPGRDQVGLGVRARARNVRAGLRVRLGADVADRWCVVVDDVLTTGSTLAEATRALGAARALPLAGVVLAATPAPTRGGDLGPLPRPVRAG